MCELHSTRNEVKVIGVERLANEHILSGEKSIKVKDKTALKLDLSFLGDLAPESAKPKKTNYNRNITSGKKNVSNISKTELEGWVEESSEDIISEVDGEEFNFLLE